MINSKIVHVENASYAIEVRNDGTVGIHLFNGDIKGQENLRFYGGYVTVTVAEEGSHFGSGYISLPLEAHTHYKAEEEIKTLPLLFDEDIAARKEMEEARDLLKRQVGILKGTLRQAYDKDKDIVDFLNEVMKEYKPAKECNTLADLFG